MITHDRLATHNPEIEAIWGTNVGSFYKYGDVRDLARLMRESFSDRASCFDDCVARVESTYTPHLQASRIAKAVRAVCR